MVRAGEMLSPAVGDMPVGAKKRPLRNSERGVSGPAAAPDKLQGAVGLHVGEGCLGDPREEPGLMW